MKCRDFLETSVIISAVLSLNLEGLQAVPSMNTVAIEKVLDMAVVMGGEPKVMLDKVLEALDGIGNPVKKGQKIVVEPNISWDRSPELIDNTNPRLAKVSAKKRLGAGASKVTVFDHICGNWQKCYETGGIVGAVKEAGGIIMSANDEKYFKEVSIPSGADLKSAKIHEAPIEASAWTNVLVSKNHGGARMICTMKGYMEIIRNHRSFHQSDLQQCITDICTRQKKPVLSIVGVYRITYQNGPQGKSAADVVTLKSLIASPSIVTIDTTALRLFNQVKKLDTATAGHIGKGGTLKLGMTNLDNVTIKCIKI